MYAPTSRSPVAALAEYLKMEKEFQIAGLIGGAFSSVSRFGYHQFLEY